MYPEDASTASELMRRADTALYQAKAASKNACRFFGQRFEEQITRRAKVERELLGALDAGRFSLAYQPEVDLEAGTISGYEVFLRWDVADGPQARAREFLSILDESGDIVRVGRWVLRETCAEAARWGRRRGRLSINVSSREFADPDFVEAVQAALRLHGVSGEQIELELTESILSNNVADARVKLPELTALGVTLAIDDYGAGRSSLSELAELPIATLKMHESLIRNVLSGRRRAALSAVIEAGKALGFRVVAKAVETPEQLSVLRDSGCRHAQGILFGYPSPALAWRANEAEAIELLAERSRAPALL